MTREEAIEILKDWDGYFIGHSSDDVTEALDMAIKTLEQEPSSDAISRQAVNNLQKYRYNCGDTSITCISLKSVNELPPVKPQPCEDAVSRQAVIDSLHSKFADGFDSDRWWNSMSVLYAINKVPSVNPQPTGHWLHIDDVMSVFDDFMCGEVDEEGTDTFLEMLRDKAEQ